MGWLQASRLHISNRVRRSAPAPDLPFLSQNPDDVVDSSFLDRAVPEGTSDHAAVNVPGHLGLESLVRNWVYFESHPEAMEFSATQFSRNNGRHCDNN